MNSAICNDREYHVPHLNEPGEYYTKWNVCWACSAMSDSLWPHGLEPTGSLCPWDSLGKNTGVGCHFFLQGIFSTQGANLHLLQVSCISRKVLYHWATWEVKWNKSNEERQISYGFTHMWSIKWKNKWTKKLNKINSDTKIRSDLTKGEGSWRVGKKREGNGDEW